MRLFRRVSVVVGVAAACAAATVTPTARADVLINMPPGRTCVTRGAIQVGVWYKAVGSTNRGYAIRIFDPNGHLVFYRHGIAPSNNWTMWRYRPTRIGVYRTIYYPRTRYSTFATSVVVCAQPQPTLRTVGRATSAGDFAITIASGSVKRPRAIYVKVQASPSQAVSVSWTMVCSRGPGAGSRSGDFVTYPSLLHALPFPMASPDDCTVSASGQLNESGSIVVTILAAT